MAATGDKRLNVMNNEKSEERGGEKTNLCSESVKGKKAEPKRFD